MNGKSLVLSCLLILTAPHWALAHPETGHLPDAVAEVEYQVALETAPNDIKTRNKLGMVFLRKKKLKEAAGAFGEVLRLAPHDFEATWGMGRTRLKEGKPAEAIGWLKKAASLSNEHTDLYRDLGTAYENSGDLVMAEASYRKGIELSAALIKREVHTDHVKSTRTSLVTALRSVQAKIKSAKVAK